MKARGLTGGRAWTAAAAVLLACGSSGKHHDLGSGGGSGQPGSDTGGSGLSGQGGANQAGQDEPHAGTGDGGAPSEPGGASGETDQGGASDQGPLAPLIAAYCAAARSCCSAAGEPLEPLSGCERAFVEQSDNVLLAKTGHVEIDAQALAGCVAAYTEAKATCVLDGVLAACHGIFIGNVAAEGACSDVLECDRSKGPKVCLRIQGSADALGICKTPPRGKDGDACAQSCETDGNCSSNASSPDASVPLTLCHEEDGLYCSLGTSCVPLGATGDECTFDEACGSGGYCDSTCKPLGAAGDACQFDFACGLGLACVNGACVPAPVASEETCVGYPPSFD